MSGEKSTHVSEKKKKIVAELADLIKTKKTVLIASIKNLPAAMFQDISKKLRGKAIVKVPKKNLILRAIESSADKEVKKLEEVIKSDVAILFSDLDSFELAGELLDNKSPAKAKVGQEAPEDIVVQAGPTDLVPGPAISELGSVGLQVQVENGKLTIKEDRIIVKGGEVIKENAADVMSKLDIKPFSIGFIPLCAFDTKEKKFYAEINIDKEGTLEKLKDAHGRALPFAVEVGYPSEDTISFLIGKGHSHAKALEGLAPVEEGSKEEGKEESKEAPAEDAVEKAAADEKTDGEVKEVSAEEGKDNQTQSDKPEGENK
jgi:large subunit ribosomal protein L10